jgi:predicted ATPase/class 3 adenylate cyclase/DNA-binding XRE family transcriptional regulator
MESSYSFGYWVRRQRKALDLTQQMLADRVGCSIAAIKKIESDERRPSRQIAERLADILHVPAEQRGIFLECARGLRPVDQLELTGRPAQKSSPLPTGTVTFLYTDIEGSTQLWDKNPQAMAVAHPRHNQILREAIESNHGYVFQVIGDAFCAAFHTARDAVQAAVKAQMQLQTENWGDATIRVRMGIHTGEAEAHPNEYHGYVTLSLVQRLMSAGHGGQILLSHTTEKLLHGHLPKDVALLDLGEHTFKDISQPVHVFQVIVPGLESEFPALRTLDALPNNLPLQLTSFIGRERELEEVQQMLANTRLLTLTGPGGTGKTRLSLQIGERLLSSFTDGVWIAELAPLTDPASLPQTIAAIFGLRELPNMPLNTIVMDYLRAKQLLLILDNCEHLVKACATFADQLLHACPQLKILASSREALGVAGEAIYHVPSLSLPDPDPVTREALMHSESVRLFVERAIAAQSQFNLTDQNASAVAQICSRLDGIPLALELAAARVTLFSPEQIASRLNDRFKLLTGGSRTALERHQTLSALIDWSYDILSEEEQTLFRQLSVFAGGWTFEAAEALCKELDVLDLLTQLINKSLVMVEEQAMETRYHLLETIRQYGHNKLLGAGEAEQIRNRHLEFFLRFAERAESHYNSLQEREWMSRLEADYDNLRAALDWALEQDVSLALRLATTLSPYWSRHGMEAEGNRTLSEALARFKALPKATGEAERQRITLQGKALGAIEVLSFAYGDFMTSLNVAEEVIELSRGIGEKHILSGALSYLGVIRAYLGDKKISISMADEALTLAREIGDRVLVGLALTNMAGVIAMTEGDPQKVKAYSEKGIGLLQEAGAQWGVAMSSFGAGLFAARQGNYAEALSQFEASIPVFTELGDKHRINMAYSEIGHVERRQGHYKHAKRNYHKTLLEWQRLGHRAAVAHELECLAMIAKAEEEEQRAAILFGAAEALRESISLPMTPIERMEYEREVNDLRVNMDEAAFKKAWADGRALSIEQVIALALENNDGDIQPSR